MTRLNFPVTVKMKLLILLIGSIGILLLGSFFLLKTAYLLMEAGRYESAFIVLPLAVFFAWFLVILTKMALKVARERRRK